MITLYSTHCPKCRVLEEKLNKYNIEYETVTDTQVMVEKGMRSAPGLEVDGKLMDFSAAIIWLKQFEK